MAQSNETMIAIPHGGPRNISADVGKLFMKQIDIFTVRTGREIDHVGNERDALMASMPADQLEKAHAIAQAIVNMTRGD